MDSEIRERPAADPIVLAHARPFRLGAVEVRPPTREIIGPRGRETLEPRVMQVLVALARADGEFVTRDDLIASCWDGRIVGEDAITRVISRLRRHTEGVGRDGWRLETVTKVGYRLLPADHDPDVAAAPARAAPSRRGLVLGASGVAVLAGGAAGLLVWRRRKPPVSPEAEALYDKGREAMRQGLAEPTAQAVGFLRQAVAVEPEYADAWGALARAYQSSLVFTEPTRQEGVAAQSRAAARRALELDPDQAEAAAALALLAPVYCNWANAEWLYVRALRLHPGEPNLSAAYSRLLLGLGRSRAALTAAQAGVRGDRFAPYNRNALALALWSVGRTEEAERVLREALALWPRHRALWFPLFYLLSFSGRVDQALAFAAERDKWPASAPLADVQATIARAQALQSGGQGGIDAAAAGVIQSARQGVGYAESALGWLCAFGRIDDAFTVARGAYLGEGFAIGEQRYSADQGRFAPSGARNTYYLFLPSAAAMRADPRFGPLMRDIGIASYWKSSGKGPDDPALAKGPLA